MTGLQDKKILMVIAPGNFRDEEFQQPKEIFQASGAQVTVASRGVKEAKGMLGAVVKVDLDLNKVKTGDYQAVVFVGGSGSSIYFKNQLVLDLVKKAVSQRKVVAAICIAPTILAKAGVLQGKKATSFPSERSQLEAQGAVYINQPVVVDDLIVTGQGPQAASAFGKKIVQLLNQ